MPKEIIHDRYFNQYARSHEHCNHETSDQEAVCHGVEVPLATGGVKIGWSKDPGDHLEIAVLRDVVADPDGMGEMPWHVQLDRRGLNAMIRTLKRAGRQAFGSDEW